MSILEITSLTWTVTLLGYAIVFTALIGLVLIFLTVPKIHAARVKRRLEKQGKLNSSDAISTDNLEVSGDENAAIAMALYMYFNELHDDESNVITIKRIEKRYSPWNSKIYGLNNVNLK